ncbi:sugar transferase [Microvirga sp. KLBC 81]|uniref:sugar transferase n=1 Tax=Microvirga sp. KLBC 81 TaxID=1862707 RepID=UPI0014036CF8|nr:sugar transferase [Microvirga sp. KLBC 81]
MLEFGYQTNNETLHRAWNLFLGLSIALFCLPFLVIVAVLVYVDSGGPIIYRGARLGRNRVPFFLYKFRTLKPEAAEVTKNQVLPAGSGLETRIGRVLRETRLDEIPQLWNIIRGDMNLFGPRPVRAEIAQIYAQQIKHYDQRFLVKPGIVGHTQVFMPHGASKRIRARYNNILVKRPVNPVKEILFLAFVGSTALMKLALVFARALAAIPARRTPSEEQIGFHPQTFPGISIELCDRHNKVIARGAVTAISEESISFVTDLPVTEQSLAIRLRRNIRDGKARRAACIAHIRSHLIDGRQSAHAPSEPSPPAYVATYKTNSDFQKYLIDTYFTKSRFAGLN